MPNGAPGRVPIKLSRNLMAGPWFQKGGLARLLLPLASLVFFLQDSCKIWPSEWCCHVAKEARVYNGEKTVFSISGAGKTGQLHVKE